MPRTSIQQFRAALAGHADQSRLMHAYRQLAHRPTAIGGRVGPKWAEWPAMAVASDWVTWQTADAASFSGPEEHLGARFAAWGDWATPPAAAA
jgi:hypothetical protein